MINEGFQIDEASSNDTYLYVDIPAHLISLQIKIEGEGVVVDAYPMNDCLGSESLATMCVEAEQEDEPSMETLMWQGRLEREDAT